MVIAERSYLYDGHAGQQQLDFANVALDSEPGRLRTDKAQIDGKVSVAC